LARNIVIVGDSIASIGALLSVLSFAKSEDKIFHVIDPRKNAINYQDTDQMNRYLGKYGTSNNWHAVSPVYNNYSKVYKLIFKTIYGYEIKSDSPRLFVPYLRPSTQQAIENVYKKLTLLFENNFNKLNKFVEKIDWNFESEKKIFFSDKTTLKADIVCLCINVLDVVPILGIDKSKFTIFDHKQSLQGIIDLKINKPSLSRKVFNNLYGYLFEYESTKNCISFLKPFYGDPLKANEYQNFGKTTSKIIKEVILSPDIGSKLNAISSKLGLRTPARYFSLWSQEIVKRNITKISDLYVPTTKDEPLENYDHKDQNIINFRTEYKIPGNHFIGILEKEVYDQLEKSKIIFSTLRDDIDSFDGRHSSLLISEYIYEKLSSIL